jgi:hypothetical protein
VPPKSIYIAGAYGRKQELCEYADALKERDVFITSSWLRNEGPDITELEMLTPMSRAVIIADRDIEEIREAEAFLFFSSRNHEIKGRGGRHTEFGIAWTLGVQVYLIGEPEHVFHSMVAAERRFGMFHNFYEEHYGTKVST